MKKLLIGNEAVARGIYEAGVKVVSSYPGTPSTEITEFVAKYDDVYSEWAPNEKVALEVAFGASLAGARAGCAMKHVGLNVAADPLFTMSYTGVNGGLVTFVADDPGMHSSQNEQDSRHYAIASIIPMVEPADSDEALRFTKAAYELSEKFDTPFLFRICTRVAHSQSLVTISDRENVENVPYKKNPSKYIMTPGNARVRRPIVEQRMHDLVNFAETTDLNTIEYSHDSDIGILTSGTSYMYVKEIFGDRVNVLKFGLVNPLPVQKIKDFAAHVKKLYVIEELEPIIENHCRNIGVDVIGKDLFSSIGEFSQSYIAKVMGEQVGEYTEISTNVPVRPPVMCAGCPHRGMFYVLSKHKISVLGDIGCYTLGAAPPLNALDSTLCMGASISGLHGFNKVLGGDTNQKSVCVIGDSTFMHSGMTGLANVSYNDSNSTVIVLDNSITGMTGHQHNPTTGYNIKGDPANKIDLELLCRALGINRIRVVDPYNIDECEKAVLEEIATDEPSVIISRRPCALLKTVKAKPPVKVDNQKCIGCKKCMKFGCPAISMKGGKSVIDNTLCIGCAVCTQLCPFGAIE